MKKIELHIPNDLGYERIAMESAAAVARMMGFSEDRVEDLKTALAEACINAIEHASKKRKAEKLLVTLTVAADRLQVDIYDKGEQFEIHDQKPDIKSRMEGNVPSRGWGIFLIKNLVDSLEVSSTKEGNTTSMVIYLHRT
ncbi:MAG: ATP-binding protein [bacterium]